MIDLSKIERDQIAEVHVSNDGDCYAVIRFPRPNEVIQAEIADLQARRFTGLGVLTFSETRVQISKLEAEELAQRFLGN